MMEDQAFQQAKILGETAKISWRELQPWFAKGAVVHVVAPLNLVEVAYALSVDDKASFQGWMEQKKVGPVSDAQALVWYEHNASLWTVVVRPWILVQESGDTSVRASVKSM